MGHQSITIKRNYAQKLQCVGIVHTHVGSRRSHVEFLAVAGNVDGVTGSLLDGNGP